VWPADAEGDGGVYEGVPEEAGVIEGGQAVIEALGRSWLVNTDQGERDACDDV
jgi:hypothetical protein